MMTLFKRFQLLDMYHNEQLSAIQMEALREWSAAIVWADWISLAIAARHFHAGRLFDRDMPNCCFLISRSINAEFTR